MPFYWMTLGILAVWRITHLLAAEDGPINSVVWLRRRAGAGFWGALLDCFYCLSLWIAVPFAYLAGETWKQRLLLWPALSGAAILLERLSSKESVPVAYLESEEQDHAMLRKQESPGGNPAS